MWEFPISSEKLKTTEDPSVRAGIPARTEGPFYDLQVRPPGRFPVVSCCAPVPAAIKAEAVLGVPAGSRQLSGNKKTVEDACASSTVFFLKNGAIGASRTRDPLLRRQMLYPTELQPHNKIIITIAVPGRKIRPCFHQRIWTFHRRETAKLGFRSVPTSPRLTARDS